LGTDIQFSPTTDIRGPQKIFDLTDRRRLPCAEFPQLHCRILIPLGAAMKRREFIFGSATVAIVPPTLLARADEVIE
jgi:hypothetical protein